MQDGVLVHLAAQVHPGVDVLFLDTGYHFAETIGTRDAVEQVYGVNVINARAEASVVEQDAAEGKDLFAREPNRCCALRKVAPLKKTLSGYKAWVTGIRRVEAPTRANAPPDLVRRRVRSGEDQPDRRVVRRRHAVLHRRALDSGESARRRGISVHRVRSVHQQASPPAAIRAAAAGPVRPRQNAGCTPHDHRHLHFPRRIRRPAAVGRVAVRHARRARVGSHPHLP